MLLLILYQNETQPTNIGPGLLNVTSKNKEKTWERCLYYLVRQQNQNWNKKV